MTKENILFSDEIMRQREQIALLEKQLQDFKDKSD